jgi:hypothetical protein
MGIPISEVGYTSATTVRGDHEVHKGHVVGLEKKIYIYIYIFIKMLLPSVNCVKMLLFFVHCYVIRY